LASVSPSVGRSVIQSMRQDSGVGLGDALGVGLGVGVGVGVGVAVIFVGPATSKNPPNWPRHAMSATMRPSSEARAREARSDLMGYLTSQAVESAFVNAAVIAWIVAT